MNRTGRLEETASSSQPASPSGKRSEGENEKSLRHRAARLVANSIRPPGETTRSRGSSVRGSMQPHGSSLNYEIHRPKFADFSLPRFSPYFRPAERRRRISKFPPLRNRSPAERIATNPRS